MARMTYNNTISMNYCNIIDCNLFVLINSQILRTDATIIRTNKYYQGRMDEFIIHEPTTT